MSGSGSSGISGSNAMNVGSNVSSSKRKNVLLPDAERRPVLLEEAFIDRLLQMASMAFPHPMNPAAFALHTSVPTLHRTPSPRPPPGSAGESMLDDDPLSRCSSSSSYPPECPTQESFSAYSRSGDMIIGKDPVSPTPPYGTWSDSGGKKSLFLSMMMGSTANSSMAPSTTGSPSWAAASGFATAGGPVGSSSLPTNSSGGGQPSPASASIASPAGLPVLSPAQVTGTTPLSTSNLKENIVAQDGVVGVPRLGQEDYEFIALHLSSCIARSLNMEDYWTNLKSQIKVDSLVLFVFYCAHHRFSALKSLHLLEFLQDYEDLVAAGCNKEGELVAAAAEEAASRAAAAQAALVGNAPLAEGREGEQSGSTTAVGAGGGDGSARGDSSKASKKKADSKEKKRTKPPSKKEKLAALAAEEERKRKEQEVAELVLEAERQRQLAAERSLLSWEEMLLHTMKDFLTSELELGWRWDQFPWHSNKAAGLLNNGHGGTVAGAAGNGVNGGAAVATAATGPAGAAEGKSSGGGSSGGKKKGEKARLLQLQEQEEEQKRLAAAAAALPRENIYLRPQEIPLFTTLFLGRGLLQHASLYQYVLRHTCMEEDERPPLTYHLATEFPMESVPPIWTASYKGLTNPYLSPQSTALSHHMGNPTPPFLHHRSSNGDEGSTGTNLSTSSSVGGGGHAAGASPSSPVASHGGSGNKLAPHPPSGAEGRERGSLSGAPGRLTNVPGGVRERHLAVAMAEFYAAQEAELEGLEKAHQEAVELEKERARIAEEERQMSLLFQDKKKTEVVEDVYDSVQDCLTSRQLHILERIDALEVQLGISKAVNIPSVLQKDSGKDSSGKDGKKKGAKKKKNP